ncbi:MAG: hypothetical protein ACYC5H_07750 [Methylovirgula sp.]
MNIVLKNADAMQNGSLFEIVDGRVALPAAIHPLPDLLERSAESVLEAFRQNQARDFLAMAKDVEQPNSPLFRFFAELRNQAAKDNPFHTLAMFRPGALGALFSELHEHVMSHPVWRHPFFIRFFEGTFSRDEAANFAAHYFNQIKNTRQCVALAAGRFHGLLPMPYGHLNARISELTQMVLAQLVADEYGVDCHGMAGFPGLEGLLRTKTHIGMFRQLFEGLGVAPEQQDVPMLPGVADNVLTQRLLAGDPAFTPLEALASVGLGMEWGVPEFFSLLLGGLIRFGRNNEMALTPSHLEVFIEHVRFDALHAVSVMLVTSMHMRSADDLAAVKGACNMLMSSRYAMMSDLYAHVFKEPCSDLMLAGVEPRYQLSDHRIVVALATARRSVRSDSLLGGQGYGERAMPFCFAI